MKKRLLSIVASFAIASSAVAMDNKVYATVNGDNITSSDIAVALRDPRIQFESLPSSQQKQIINSLIEQKLLSQEALKSDVVKSKDYKDELEKLKQLVAYQLWMRDLSKEIKVSHNEIKKFYNENKTKFNKPLELKASHILVKTEKEAYEVINALEKPFSIGLPPGQRFKLTKKRFSDLAKEKSTGPSGVNGGELGWFTKDKMVPEFSEAASKLEIGSFTKAPVQTQFGFHIIFLDGRKQPTLAKFEEVKTAIEQQLTQTKFFDMIKDKSEKLKQKAKIIYK